MNTLASMLVASAAAVILLLGSVHMAYTFHGQRLHPRDPALRERMAEVHPRLTRETTMWRAWVGFNASHSLGALLFGLTWGWLALAAPAVLFGSWFLQGLGLALLLSYTLLGLRYWFSVPLAGIGLALALYLLGLFVAGR